MQPNFTISNMDAAERIDYYLENIEEVIEGLNQYFNYLPHLKIMVKKLQSISNQLKVIKDNTNP